MLDQIKRNKASLYLYANNSDADKNSQVKNKAVLILKIRLAGGGVGGGAGFGFLASLEIQTLSIEDFLQRIIIASSAIY